MSGTYLEAPWTAKTVPPPQLHYHIRWSSKAALDWESFNTRAEAEDGASQLVRPGETYIIEEHDSACQRCRTAFELKRNHSPAEATRNPPVKYPWQRAVTEASTETRSEYLPGKVNAAECAISARLCDVTPINSEEHSAIREALAFLQYLLPNRAEPKEESKAKSA